MEFMVSPSFLVLLNTHNQRICCYRLHIGQHQAQGEDQRICGHVDERSDSRMEGQQALQWGRGNSAAFKYTTQPARLELLPGEGSWREESEKSEKKFVLRTTQTDEEQEKRRVEAARVEREQEDVG